MITWKNNTSFLENLIKDKKYIEYGKAAKTKSQNFHWNKIIEKYKRIL